MSTSQTNSKITYCPPMPAHGILAPEPRFANSKKRNARSPMHTDFHANGEMTSTGIAFDDFEKMQVHTRRTSNGNGSKLGGRKLETPAWALSNRETQLLLAAYFERSIRRAREFKQGKGTPKERLAHAWKVLQATIPAKIAVMHELCVEHLALKNSGADPARMRALEIQIENLDSSIMNIRRGPALIAAIVMEYYRRAQDCVAVAVAFNVKPPYVRRLLFKLNRLHEKLGEVPVRKRLPNRKERIAAGVCAANNRCGKLPMKGRTLCVEHLRMRYAVIMRCRARKKSDSADRFFKRAAQDVLAV